MQHLSVPWHPPPPDILLPEEAQCPLCGGFDAGHPDVRRILQRRSALEYPRASPGYLMAMAQCRCTEREESRRLLRHQEANLPHQDTPWTFATSPVSGLAKEYALLFAQGEGPRCLLLMGGTGTGKSGLLESMGREALGRGRTVRYELVSSLLDRLRHTYADRNDDLDLHELIGWYQRSWLLLLDDLGMEKASDWAAERVTALVDERLRMGLRLAVATNLAREAMAERMGERLASRLFQGAQSAEVQMCLMEGQDRRAGPGR